MLGCLFSEVSKNKTNVHTKKWLKWGLGGWEGAGGIGKVAEVQKFHKRLERQLLELVTRVLLFLL